MTAVQEVLHGGFFVWGELGGMRGVCGVELSSGLEGSAAGVRRGGLQTLLVNTACEEGVEFASGRVLLYPGKHSPRLGIPGLNYAAPLVLVWERGGIKKSGILTRMCRVPGIMEHTNAMAF